MATMTTDQHAARLPELPKQVEDHPYQGKIHSFSNNALLQIDATKILYYRDKEQAESLITEVHVVAVHNGHVFAISEGRWTTEYRRHPTKKHEAGWQVSEFEYTTDKNAQSHAVSYVEHQAAKHLHSVIMARIHDARYEESAPMKLKETRKHIKEQQKQIRKLETHLRKLKRREALLLKEVE